MSNLTNRNVASLILVDGDGKILFQRRTKDSKRFAGLLSLFGGGLEANETPTQAVVRELKEELDYPVTSPAYLGENPYTLSETNETGIQYVFTEAYDPSKTFHLNEGERFEWHHTDQIPSLDLNDIDRRAVEIYTKTLCK